MDWPSEVFNARRASNRRMGAFASGFSNTARFRMRSLIFGRRSDLRRHQPCRAMSRLSSVCVLRQLDIQAMCGSRCSGPKRRNLFQSSDDRLPCGHLQEDQPSSVSRPATFYFSLLGILLPKLLLDRALLLPQNIFALLAPHLAARFFGDLVAQLVRQPAAQRFGPASALRVALLSCACCPDS